MIILILALSILITSQSWSADLGAEASAQVTAEDSLESQERFGLEFDARWLHLEGSVSANSDKRYGADLANWKGSQSLLDNYLLIDKGFARVVTDDFTVQAGRFAQAEAFESPYSLFLNSGHPVLLGAYYRYDDGQISYENRWIGLNHSSDFLTASATPVAWAQAGKTGFPERGVSLKTITFRWGTQTFGIEDAAVYTGRSFDAEYFLSPMPAYLVQYFKGTAGRPWSTGSNENTLVGFFWTTKEPDYSAGAQVLIDDLSWHQLLPQYVPDNPWKIAWTLGGSVVTPSGTWGLYHAGATKYTFEPYSSVLGDEGRTAYGYTLYPDVNYQVGSQTRGLSVQDNSLGYLHGENNLAVMVTHKLELGRHWTWATQVEGLVAGANSPANPWQDGVLALEYGTHLLDDPTLERLIQATSTVTLTVGEATLFATVRLGWVWNKLVLRNPEGTFDATVSPIDRYVGIYAPSDQSGPVASLSVGGSVSFDLGPLLLGHRRG